MKFSCEKILLQSAIATASRAVAAKSTNPAIEGLLLTCEGDMLSVCGYNMQTGIRTHIPVEAREDGQIVLPTRIFGDIIRRMPDGMITISADEKHMTHLHCGDTKFDIMGLSHEDYPELPAVEAEQSVTISERTLKSMIQQTSYAVSTNEQRPVHMGSLFEIDASELTVVSLDGFRLALRREELDGTQTKSFSFVAPGTALDEVERICGNTEDEVQITLGDRHILFELGETQLICRRLEGEFLNYKNILPKESPIVLTVNTKELLTSLERVSVVISEKLKKPVRCLFENGHVILSAKTVNGTAKDVCAIDGDGTGLEIGFNNRYLMEALRYAQAERLRIELKNSASPAIITPADGTDSFLYMVLPVRIKDGE